MSGFSPQSGSCPLLVKRGSLQIFWRFWVSRGEGQPTPLLEKTSSALRVSVAILLASPKVAKNPIVGPTSRVFAANVGRQVPLFAGQPPDDCGPLQLQIGHERSSTSRSIRVKTVSAGQRYAMVVLPSFSSWSMVHAECPP